VRVFQILQAIFDAVEIRSSHIKIHNKDYKHIPHVRAAEFLVIPRYHFDTDQDFKSWILILEYFYVEKNIVYYI